MRRSRLRGADGEGVNELAGERLNSPPKLGGVPARPSSSTKGRAGGVVPRQVVARFYLGTTPSAPALVASRHFINGAATPPNLGGELSRLPIHSQHPRLRLCKPNLSISGGRSSSMAAKWRKMPLRHGSDIQQANGRGHAGGGHEKCQWKE